MISNKLQMCYNFLIFLTNKLWPDHRKAYPPCMLWKIILQLFYNTPESKVHGANLGPTWVLSAPDGPHVGPMNLAIRDDHLPRKVNIIDISWLTREVMLSNTIYVSWKRNRVKCMNELPRQSPCFTVLVIYTGAIILNYVLRNGTEQDTISKQGMQLAQKHI